MKAQHTLAYILPVGGILLFGLWPSPAAIVATKPATAQGEAAPPPQAQALPFEFAPSGETRQAVDGLWTLPLIFQQAFRYDPIACPEE